jgi:hypothetical protein
MWWIQRHIFMFRAETFHANYKNRLEGFMNLGEVFLFFEIM